MPARVPTPARRDGDTEKSYAALCDYARMGAGRSLSELHRSYTDPAPETAPPTVSFRWLKEWSRTHDWQARVAEFDEARRAIADEEAEREMLEGLALPSHRVRALKMLAGHMLSDEAEDGDEDDAAPGGLAWLTMTLANPQRLAQLRGLLSDLAAETGGRKQNLDLTTKGESLNDARRELTDGATPKQIAEAYRDLLRGDA